MTNNSIAAARSALVTLLGTVSEIQQVAYGRTTDVSSGYPYCRVYFDGVTGDWEDQQSWNASYSFAIELYQEISAKSKAQAEEDLEDVAYEVIRALVTGWRLSGAADDTQIQASPAEEVNTQQGPAVMLKITLYTRSLIY